MNECNFCNAFPLEKVSFFRGPLNKMQRNHDIQGETYLNWNCNIIFNETQENFQDAKTRKRKLQFELSRALAALGIKPATFHSLVIRNQIEELKILLDSSMKQRTENFVKSKKKIKEKFNVDLEVVDLPTVHEAFQFLVQKFVETNQGIQLGLVTGLDIKEMRKLKNEENQSK